MIARLLILGGSSPLGQCISNALSEKDTEVTVTSRSDHGERLDVRDDVALRRVILDLQPQGVVYLPSPTPAELDDDSLAEEMSVALRRTLIHSRAAGAQQFVFASSAAVYGTDAAEPFSEEGGPVGHSAHARFKLAGERIAGEVGGSDMTVSSLRFFNLYGPGFHRSLINRLVEPAERPTMRLGAEFIRDYVHGADAAAATVAALQREPGQPPRAFNIGTGEGTSNARLAELVPAESYEAGPPGVPSYSVADTARARRELGFVASIHVAAAVSNPIRYGVLDTPHAS